MTIITVLTPVSCDHVVSFNYDCKKPNHVDFTCRYHLPLMQGVWNSLFCFCFYSVVFLLYLFSYYYFCFTWNERMESIFSLQHQCWKSWAIRDWDRWDWLALMKFEFWNMSKDFRLWLSLWSLVCFVEFVLLFFNKRCCILI